jgi:glycosyltransferase involved in cell wall biosynthesis
LAAWRLRASDRIALSLADLVLCDTWEHGDFYSAEYGVPRSKLCRVPVGADRQAFRYGEAARPPRLAGPLQVVYIGGFLPLHGVETAVEAATILEGRHGPRFASFALIGDGMTAPRAERDIAARGLRSVRRLPRVPYRDALAALSRADVALGIFGTTPKAGRVVPHKVFQSMAAGIPTITRRSRAIAEFFREGEHLILVPAGDAAALAKAVEELAGDPDRGARIGMAGRASAQEQASPERIGALLAEAIARVRETTAPKVRR